MKNENENVRSEINQQGFADATVLTFTSVFNFYISRFPYHYCWLEPFRFSASKREAWQLLQWKKKV